MNLWGPPGVCEFGYHRELCEPTQAAQSFVKVQIFGPVGEFSSLGLEQNWGPFPPYEVMTASHLCEPQIRSSNMAE